jgi:hypothetical protein
VARGEEGGFERMKPKNLTRKATTIYEMANARLADLGTRGTTAERLATPKVEIAAYDKAVCNSFRGLVI